MRRSRPYYRRFSEGLPIADGQVVKYLAEQGGNSHAYLLRSLSQHIAGATPDYGRFEVLNPTTFVMNRATAISSNPILLNGDKLYIIDENTTLQNDDSVALLYSTIYDEKYHASPLATVIFETGENPLQHYELNNSYQIGLATSFWATSYKSVFILNILKCPDDFHGFVRVANKTEFAEIRDEYPVIGTNAVEVQMQYPAGITVTATYDTASSYTNTGTIDDYFYLEFERVGGGNLVVTKHPINTEP